MKNPFCVRGEVRMYEPDFKVLDERLIETLKGRGIPAEDLRVMAERGFLYCETRHSFFKLEGGLI